ncbi:hypothetical protein B0H10DRAFT_1959184 [Mycena sp. CBHHK59/15]|nr:hypothetical protein B0H10DRAFT_1959184 [Mycena sp. CBHHK59/15]
MPSNGWLRAQDSLSGRQEDPAASPTGVGNLDVGAALEPFLTYTGHEKALLIGSKEVVDATSPLPVFMVLWIAGEHLKVVTADATDKAKCEKDRAEKEAEKTKASCPIFGTQLMQNLHPILAVVSGPVPIPDIFHVTLHHKIYFPLHWWGNKILRQATSFPRTIPVETITAVQTSVLVVLPTVCMVNMGKALKDLGDEDLHSLTPGLWRQASINQLVSFQRLCPPIVPGDPSSLSHMHASEYEKHILFFVNLDCFEDLQLLPVWYLVEHKLWYEIYKDGFFNARLYESHIEITISMYEQTRTLGLPFVLAPLSAPFSSAGQKCLAVVNAITFDILLTKHNLSTSYPHLLYFQPRAFQFIRIVAIITPI